MSMMKYVAALCGIGLLAGVRSAAAVELSAFADVAFQENTADSARNSFVLGGFDLYASQEIDSKTQGFVELVFEDVGEGYVVDLERLYIKRRISPAFAITAGRMHAPLGYWNSTYHHGALLFDTVSRPAFIEFEDAGTSILPMHVIGLSVSGQLHKNHGALAYEVVLANNTFLTTDGYTLPAGFAAGEIGVNNVSSDSEKKLIIARVDYTFDAFPLQLGLFGMDSPVIEAGGNAGAVAARGVELISQRVLGVDLRYENDKFDAIAEVYNISNKDKIGAAGSKRAMAYYVQLGYRLTSRLKSVIRHEALSFKGDDPYFQYLNRSEGRNNVLGLRYDLDESNALKLEINHADPEQGSSETLYSLQWAFMMY